MNDVDQDVETVRKHYSLSDDERRALDCLEARVRQLEQGRDDIDSGGFDYADMQARIHQLESALREIRNERKPQVCENYELCTHEGCRASYEAFVIADNALSRTEDTPPQHKEQGTRLVRFVEAGPLPILPLSAEDTPSQHTWDVNAIDPPQHKEVEG